MANSDAGQYERFIEYFTFRDKGALTIPKSSVAGSLSRKKCYELAVDVIIESVVTYQYRNFKSIPFNAHYGYATLVRQDCVSQLIPLKFGRNRVFEQRLDEAYGLWQSLAFWLNTEKKFLEILADSIRADGGTLANICDVPPFPFAFSEISLREVYVKTEGKSQFRIELFWVEPTYFEDSCGNGHEGESQQEDSPKDNGLPPDGTQPKKNDPSDPYGGNKPTKEPPIGSPYRNDKTDGIDSPDPSNSDEPSEPPLPSDIGTYIRYEWISLAVPPSSTPPSGFPDFQGIFLFDADLSNVYTIGVRCDGDVGISYFKNGSPRGCASASGYRLESLSFPRRES